MPIRSHETLPDAGPSLIDLWELAEADDRQDIEGWRAPFDGVSATSPEVKLSRRIQAEIKSLVEGGTMTGSTGKRRRCATATCWCWCGGAATPSTP